MQPRRVTWKWNGMHTTPKMSANSSFPGKIVLPSNICREREGKVKRASKGIAIATGKGRHKMEVAEHANERGSGCKLDVLTLVK